MEKEENFHAASEEEPRRKSSLISRFIEMKAILLAGLNSSARCRLLSKARVWYRRLDESL